MKSKLGHIAAVLRSKNAGPFQVTFDIMFNDKALFEYLRDTGQITRERFAETYELPTDAVEWTEYAPAFGFKATVQRAMPCGDPSDGDVYGCQQHAPLLIWDVDIPDELDPSSEKTREVVAGVSLAQA
jgi:hypothetical protein